MRVADFDGDGKSDVGAFRHSAGNYYMLLGTKMIRQSDGSYGFADIRRNYFNINNSNQFVHVGNFLGRENASVLASVHHNPYSAEVPKIPPLYETPPSTRARHPRCDGRRPAPLRTVALRKGHTAVRNNRVPRERLHLHGTHHQTRIRWIPAHRDQPRMYLHQPPNDKAHRREEGEVRRPVDMDGLLRAGAQPAPRFGLRTLRGPRGYLHGR